ncbi:hypothetical protein IAQ61_003110 [Plenodomus lingam]|uniref:Uncharacterized protein n=1 Tax=Leptosphaeria maculans (strain JN3 / isolate v23.1.3 / race Av1-4-5-6-7-8) TaxID=985895 RepID=E5ADJ9_LEPMJ|nr:hypothetical protein LEMA_P000750.1 [Plenodomus lingam JN3]KAH9875646.1 hypothetical protein IAQ61_003110 [Plenodomus lingam]CBY01288.1 hypothetical protein LEMA_P000750.1 [Plenodomus lingam JN3]
MLVNAFSRTSRQLRCTRASPILRLRGSRHVSTLPENRHIYVHQHPMDPNKKVLSLLASEPPTLQLAIGTADSLPVTPRNFTTNPHFLSILSSVFAEHAVHDSYVKSQAAVYASAGGSFLSGPNDGAGGANHQGGAGGARHGGWIHISDLRNPPDYGRIAWPEDIFGSVEVDGNGNFSGENGGWQDSGTYRVVTREGILGLTEFIWGKTVERLQELERQIKQNS